MMRNFRWLCVTVTILVGAAGIAPAAGGDAAKAPQVIILKLDDVTPNGARPGAAVSPRWQRVADYVEQTGIKASFGVIGHSLEADNPVYFGWIKALHRRGNVEFWNHGDRNRKGTDKTGEFEESYEVQKAALEKTQRLAREKLGIELRAFGAHWSGTTPETARALDCFPEIKMVFYDPKGTKKFLFERVLTLENPTFVTDFKKFKSLYENRGRGKACLALQGHPNAWDEARWAGFVQIVEYLKAQGCVFMTPSAYLATMQGKKP